MKKNLFLLVVIVCCAVARPSTNCFAQSLLTRALETGLKRLPMVATRGAFHYNGHQAKLESKIAAAAQASQHGCCLPSWKGFKPVKPVKVEPLDIEKLLSPTKKSKPTMILRMIPTELSPAKRKTINATLHALDFHTNQETAETEEQSAPEELVAPSQNPDNRQE